MITLEFLETLRGSGTLSFVFQELAHGAAALPFAYILWRKTHSWKKVLILFAVTFLIDLDHLVDYFSYYGFSLHINEVITGEFYAQARRTFVPFHAWEWVILLGVLAKIRGWKSYYTAILFGLLPHLIFDSFIVGSFLFYSIIYRGIFGFIFIP